MARKKAQETEVKKTVSEAATKPVPGGAKATPSGKKRRKAERNPLKVVKKAVQAERNRLKAPRKEVRTPSARLRRKQRRKPPQISRRARHAEKRLMFPL